MNSKVHINDLMNPDLFIFEKDVDPDQLASDEAS